MNTLDAFLRGQAALGNKLKVFDWVAAARRIRAVQPVKAGAGLQDDWEYTGGLIWNRGTIVPADEAYTYLASTWAIPELDLDGVVEECWRWEDEVPGWGADTYWPPEALAILGLSEA